MAKTFVYPLSLAEPADGVVLSPNLQLRKMEEGDRIHLFGIKDVKWTEEGRLAGMAPAGGRNDFAPFFDPNVYALWASNHLLVANDDEAADDFNLVIKLLGCTRTCLSVGYGGDGRYGARRIIRPTYFGEGLLRIDAHVVEQIRMYLPLIRSRSGDSKFGLMREIWLNAQAGELRRETQFVEVTTLLEMLFLPKENSELSFRFSLRMAKMAASLGVGETRDVFNKAKTLYSIRSNLVHSGRDKRIEEYSELIFNYARLFMGAYIKHPELFDATELDKLCVDS